MTKSTKKTAHMVLKAAALSSGCLLTASLTGCGSVAQPAGDAAVQDGAPGVDGGLTVQDGGTDAGPGGGLVIQDGGADAGAADAGHVGVGLMPRDAGPGGA